MRPAAAVHRSAVLGELERGKLGLWPEEKKEEACKAPGEPGAGGGLESVYISCLRRLEGLLGLTILGIGTCKVFGIEKC